MKNLLAIFFFLFFSIALLLMLPGYIKIYQGYDNMVEVFNRYILVLFFIQADSVMNVLFYVFSSKLHQANKKAGYISIAACFFSLAFYILWFSTSIKLVDDFTKIKSIVFIIADLIMLYMLANKFKIL